MTTLTKRFEEKFYERGELIKAMFEEAEYIDSFIKQEGDKVDEFILKSDQIIISV